MSIHLARSKCGCNRLSFQKCASQKLQLKTNVPVHYFRICMVKGHTSRQEKSEKKCKTDVFSMCQSPRLLKKRHPQQWSKFVFLLFFFLRTNIRAVGFWKFALAKSIMICLLSLHVSSTAAYRSLQTVVHIDKAGVPARLCPTITYSIDYQRIYTH